MDPRTDALMIVHDVGTAWIQRKVRRKSLISRQYRIVARQTRRPDTHARHDRHSPTTGESSNTNLLGIDPGIVGQKNKCAPGVLKPVTQDGRISITTVAHGARRE